MRSPRRALAISPHLDDAVLSAGATLADYLAAGAEVHVSTLFAGAPREPLSPVAHRFHANCGLPPDGTGVAQRIDEDRAAMNELGGAHPHHLEFLDAVFRRTVDGGWLCRHHRAMFDEQRIDPRLHAALTDEVRRLLSNLAPELVLTCAAIGGHVDHLLTRAAVRTVATEADLPMLLWEDLPYGVGRPAPLGEPYQPRQASTESWARKWRAVARYESQVRMLWPGGGWKSELLTHAVDRGNGEPAETFSLASPRS
ncbi:MAG: PIG-L deacetylase family protein [Pseudonocardiaceae bacterium]